MRFLLPALALIVGLAIGFYGAQKFGPVETVPAPSPVEPLPQPEPLPKPKPEPEPSPLAPAAFTDLQGWATAELAPALIAFRRSCTAGSLKATRSALKGTAHYGADYQEPARWQEACAAAAEVEDPRAFFESYFTPYRLTAPAGKLTGYYEPELKATLAYEGLGKGRYHHPIYGWPSDLVAVDPPVLGGKGARLMGRVDESGKTLEPYPARAVIEGGETPAKPLAYLEDPAELFFLHIQGSGRLTLLDQGGKAVRAAFAAKNGQPYKSIGRYLLDEGLLPPDQATAEGIKAWLRAHPVKAVQVMQQNPSFIFFKFEEIADPALGPKGAEAVPLTAGASLAVDLSQHVLGAPLWLEAADPQGKSLNRLAIAQDTGSAILGPQRVDLFVGTGADAGAYAGTLHQDLRLWVLLPSQVKAESDGGE